MPLAIGQPDAPDPAHRRHWLLLRVRDAIPEPQGLVSAEFATIRLRLPRA